MTVHVLVAEPPRPGVALADLATGGGLGEDDAATLAGAMLQDAAAAVAASGGDLLVAHPTEDQLPSPARTGADPADELRALLDEALAKPDAVRYEPLVGETVPGRVANFVGTLLGEEDAASVAVLDGRAPTVDRTVLDGGGMALRRSEAVVAPAPGDRVAYLGLTAPLEFAGPSPLPSLSTAVDRATEPGLDVDFLAMQPRVDDRFGLATVASLIRARRAAGRRVPEHTAAAIEGLGLEIIEADGRARPRLPPSDRT